MQFIVDILKSRGKLGAVAIMLIGIGHMFAVHFKIVAGDYQTGAITFFGGLSLLGIRAKLDEPPTTP